MLEGYQLKSLVGFAEKNYTNLEDQLFFEKDPTDGRVRIQRVDGGKKFSGAFDTTVYPLDRAYDAIFLCTGWRFDPSLFAEGSTPAMQRFASDGARIDAAVAEDSDDDGEEEEQPLGSVSAKYPEIGGSYESSNQPGVYFAGTLAHGRDWRRAAGGFIHGFRYTAQALFHVLEQRLHGERWPSESLPLHVGKALSRARDRINEASGLYQMFGELTDVIAFPPPTTDALSKEDVAVRYYNSVPIGFIPELLESQEGGAATPYMTISFEYGPKHPGEERPSSSDSGRDVFRELRTPFAHDTWLGVSELIHPVARFHYPQGVAAVPLDDKRRQDPNSTMVSSWGADLWVDPTFRGEHFGNMSNSYNRSARDDGGVQKIEYHLVEDFATDWTDGQDWEAFFLFFTHCTRELIMLAIEPDGSSKHVWKHLEWAKSADKKMHWIHGTTDVPAKYQWGATPLHRAAGAKQPALLEQVLAVNPDLGARDVRSGGTALHSAASAGDAKAYEMLLEAGADATAKNDQGMAPKDLACKDSCKYKTILEELEAKHSGDAKTDAGGKKKGKTLKKKKKKTSRRYSDDYDL